MSKRIFDILISLVGLILLSPILLLVTIIIVLDSKGPPLYTQLRVGKDNKDFKLIKFRTMIINSDKITQLGFRLHDSRITKVGNFLRRYKIDEIPQLINVLKGDMSLVGPRPIVRKYLDAYADGQFLVLKVKPGMTSFASLEYINQDDILRKSEDPEQTYINQILPHKLELDLKYVKEVGFFIDLKIILTTIKKIIRIIK